MIGDGESSGRRPKQFHLGWPYNVTVGRAGRINMSPLPELSKSERGLLFTPPVTVDGRSISFHGNELLEAQQIRAASLFWDRIARPVIPFLAIPTHPDLHFLEKEGIYSEHQFAMEHMNFNGGEAVKVPYSAALELAERSAPGQWALNRGPDGFNVLDEVPVCDLQFDLHGAIPVPDKEVPLAEVLDFKLRRNSELMALRLALHDVFAKIVSDPYPELRQLMEFERLAVAIRDHLKVCAEWRQPKRLLSLSVGISPAAAIQAAAGFGVANHFGLEGFPAMLVSGAAASLSLKPGAAFSNKAKGSPYEYVSRFHDELFT